MTYRCVHCGEKDIYEKQIALLKTALIDCTKKVDNMIAKYESSAAQIIEYSVRLQDDISEYNMDILGPAFRSRERDRVFTTAFELTSVSLALTLPDSVISDLGQLDVLFGSRAYAPAVNILSRRLRALGNIKLARAVERYIEAVPMPALKKARR